MGDQSSKKTRPVPALFATAETLVEFRLKAPDPLPDARSACHAADAWSRMTGRRAVFVAVGLEESLDALPALATPYGDEIDLIAVCVLGTEAALDDVQTSGQHLARRVLRIRDEGRGRAKSAARKSQIQDFVSAAQPGVQLVLLPWSLADSEIRALIDRIVSLSEAAAVDSAKRSAPVKILDPSAQAIQTQAALPGELAVAKRPILMPGRRFLIEYEPRALIELARALQAPVVLPTIAAGAPPQIIEALQAVWPPDVPLISAAGVAWNYALIRSDCVLTLGARLTEGEMLGLHDFPFVSPAKIHAIPEEYVSERTPEPRISGPLANHGGAGLRKSRRRWCDRLQRKQTRLRSLVVRAARRSRGKQAPFDPAWIAHSIFDAAPADTVFAGEGNGAGMWMWSYNELRPTLYPDRMATIGLMLPWILGAGRAAPERPIWCFAGDGSLGYQPELFAELGRRRANAVIFVFNNRAWSSIRLEQSFLFGGRYPGTALRDRNFAELARQYGCDGVRVESEAQFLDVLERARSHRDGPLVVDVPMPRDGIPFAGLSFALAELDYLLRPMFVPFAASVLRAAAMGLIPRRIPAMLFRMVLP